RRRQRARDRSRDPMSTAHGAVQVTSSPRRFLLLTCFRAVVAFVLRSAGQETAARVTLERHAAPAQLGLDRLVVREPAAPLVDEPRRDAPALDAQLEARARAHEDPVDPAAAG